MWHSAHQQNQHGKPECFEPDRGRCDDGGFDRHHHGGPEFRHGWGDPSCHDGGGWGGGGWGGGDPGCHDGGGHFGLINFDHNSFLACH
jgi:hypothetical protein